jgi:hypothetical protein
MGASPTSLPAAVQVTRVDEVAVAEKHWILFLVGFDACRHLGQHIGSVIVEGDAAEALCLTLRAEVACRGQERAFSCASRTWV